MASSSKAPPPAATGGSEAGGAPGTGDGAATDGVADSTAPVPRPGQEKRSPALPPTPGANAMVVEGVIGNGRTCRLVDHTGSLPAPLLRELLDQLIQDKRFGLTGLSRAGGHTIRIGEPTFTHIQLEGQLFRLVLYPYEAHLDVF